MYPRSGLTGNYLTVLTLLDHEHGFARVDGVLRCISRLHDDFICSWRRVVLGFSELPLVDLELELISVCALSWCQRRVCDV